MVPDRAMTEHLMSEGDGAMPRRLHGPRAIHTHITRPVVRQLAKGDAHSVLDLGCGNAWFTDALERCGFDVVGVDRDEAGLRLARKQHPSLPLQQVDVMERLPPSLRTRFDAVVAIDLIDHVPFPRKLIEAAIAALKPGGQLIVTSTFHGYTKNLALALAGQFDSRWDPLREDGKMKYFSRATLSSLLREFDLHDVHFETIGRIPAFARSMLISAKTSTKP